MDWAVRRRSPVRAKQAGTRRREAGWGSELISSSVRVGLLVLDGIREELNLEVLVLGSPLGGPDEQRFISPVEAEEDADAVTQGVDGQSLPARGVHGGDELSAASASGSHWGLSG